MESVQVPSRSQLWPADQTDEEVYENSQLYDTLASKPKIQMLELAENIQAAETQYDSIQMQLDFMKSLRAGVYPGSTLAQNSASSLSTLKVVSSENSIPREEVNRPEEDNQSWRKEETALEDEVLRVEEEEENFRAQEQQDGFQREQEELAYRMMEPQVQVNSQTYERNIVKKDDEDVYDDGPMVINLNNLSINREDSARSIRTTSKKVKKMKKRLSEYNSSEAKAQLLNPAKTKKKKFRVKNSNSKSTVATRDTIFSDKKNDKRKLRRQKSIDTMSAIQGPQTRKKPQLKARESKQLNSKDIVEIYHNASLKSGSLSLVSGGHPKISRFRKQASKGKGDGLDDNNNNNYTDDADDILPCFDPDSGSNEKVNETTQQQQQQQQQQVQQQQQQQQQQHTHTCGHEGHTCCHEGHTCGSNYYDILTQRNYQMPTKASAMKRVHRPYRYNIRNIPFIVGTSISPSHNLGLNIQQVLSIIKTRQSSLPGISPLLVRKVSKGIKPVTTLFDQLNSCQNINEYVYDQQANGDGNSSPISSKNQGFCEPLYEVDEETRSTCSTAIGKTFDRKPDNAKKSAKSAQQMEKYRPKKKHGKISDLCNGDYWPTEEFNYPSNNKEMAEVFSRLYDQFDKMLSSYDKLKDQYEKKKDKAIAKEIAEMEEAISNKEQEITAVVNLYKEVMSLKQQMKQLHERNSFVCIATQDPTFYSSKNALARRAKTASPYLHPSHPHYYKFEDTPNTLRLAGLLKQIQAFQRQVSFT